jgi:hypothetical protein
MTSRLLVCLLGLFGLAVGAACGSEASSGGKPARYPTGPDGVFAGGHRLRAVLTEDDSGTTSFLHFWDTELEVPCAFEPLEGREEVWRCLPARARTVYDGGDVLFADDGCSEPLWPGDATTPRGAVVRRLDTRCWIARDYFRIGARFTGQAHRKTDESCVPDDAGEASATTFTLTPLGPEAFVQARLDVNAESGRIAIEELVADDGARAPHGFRDLEGDFNCWPRSTADGMRCLPTEYGWADRGLYADAGCSLAAALPERTCGERRAELAFVFSEDIATGAITAVHEAGPRLPEVYHPVDVGECSEADRETVGFEIGEPLALERFVPASFTRTARPSGLVETMARVSDSLDRAGDEQTQDVLAVPRFDRLASDTLGGYECTLAKTPDEIVRCVPPLISQRKAHYGDPACTEPIFQADWDHVSVPADLDEAATPDDFGVALRHVDYVLAGGVEHPGPVYAQRDDGCVLLPDLPNTRKPYRSFARTADLSELPALQVVAR